MSASSHPQCPVNGYEEGWRESVSIIRLTGGVLTGFMC